MVVVEGVENLFAGAARPHEAHVAEHAQLVRHRRFGEPEQVGDVAHAQLSARQRVEDPDTRRVAEHLEGFGERRDGAVDEQPRAERRQRPAVPF